jgi:hypothetical protein
MAFDVADRKTLSMAVPSAGLKKKNIIRGSLSGLATVHNVMAFDVADRKTLSMAVPPRD